MSNDKWQIYIDGGARGNPGPAAAGVVIYSPQGSIIKQSGKYLGKTTNNLAEYQGAILGLTELRNLIGRAKAKKIIVRIKSDSELLVKQINHQYKIKNENLIPYFIKLWNLMLDFKEVNFIHIPRSENKLADQMVNETLNERGY